MRITLTIPDGQMLHIDRMIEAYGLVGRSEAIRYLLTQALKSEIATRAIQDQADAMQFFKESFGADVSGGGPSNTPTAGQKCPPPEGMRT